MIEFTLVEGYTQLREIIKAHGYDLSRRRGALPAPEEVAADWYDTVYRPGVEAVRRASLPELYATYKCTNCGYELEVGSTKNLPPCPSCHNGQYDTLSGGDSASDPYPDRT